MISVDLWWSCLVCGQPRLQLLRDAVAGITVGVLAVPQSLSYATVAGLPPQHGLYNSFVALFPYFLLGTSPHVIIGPTALTSILTRTEVPSMWHGQPVEVGTPVYAQMCFLLNFMVGLMQFVFGALKLGVVVDLVSSAVIAGFTSGAAFLVAATQFSTFLGIPHCQSSSGGKCDFLGEAMNMFRHIKDVKPGVVITGIICVSTLVGFKKLKPHLRGNWAMLGSLGPLLLVGIAIPLFALSGDAPALKPIPVVGHIEAGLPTFLFPFHNLDVEALGELFTGAFVIAALGYMETMTIAKTIARKYGGYRVEPSQELLSLGASNLLCSQFRGYPVAGCFSRTVVNADSGATSMVASLFSGLVIAIACLFLTPVLQHLPDVVLASMIMVAVGGLIEFSQAKFFWKANKKDFLVFIITFLLEVVAGVVVGLVAGLVLHWSLVLLRYRGRGVKTALIAVVEKDRIGGDGRGGVPAPYSLSEAARRESSRPRLMSREDVPAPTQPPKASDFAVVDLAHPRFADSIADADSQQALFPQRRRIAVIAFNSPLHFASANILRKVVDEAVDLCRPRWLVLDCRDVASLDASGVLAVSALQQDLEGADAKLIIAGLEAKLQHSLHRGLLALEQMSMTRRETVGPSHMSENLNASMDGMGAEMATSATIALHVAEPEETPQEMYAGKVYMIGNVRSAVLRALQGVHATLEDAATVPRRRAPSGGSASDPPPLVLPVPMSPWRSLRRQTVAEERRALAHRVIASSTSEEEEVLPERTKLGPRIELLPAWQLLEVPAAHRS